MTVHSQQIVTDTTRRYKHLHALAIEETGRFPFWGKFSENPTTGCWEWQGVRSRDGYGRSSHGRTTVGYTHRIAYSKLVGPVPDGLELDHLCRNPPCGNPAHLEPVTHHVNLLRGMQAQQTHCVNGHPFDSENLVMRFRRSGAPYRQCKTCVRIRAKQQTAKQMADSPDIQQWAGTSGKPDLSSTGVAARIPDPAHCAPAKGSF